MLNKISVYSLMLTTLFFSITLSAKTLTLKNSLDVPVTIEGGAYRTDIDRPYFDLFGVVTLIPHEEKIITIPEWLCSKETTSIEFIWKLTLKEFINPVLSNWWRKSGNSDKQIFIVNKITQFIGTNGKCTKNINPADLNSVDEIILDLSGVRRV